MATPHPTISAERLNQMLADGRQDRYDDIPGLHRVILRQTCTDWFVRHREHAAWIQRLQGWDEDRAWPGHYIGLHRTEDDFASKTYLSVCTFWFTDADAAFWCKMLWG